MLEKTGFKMVIIFVLNFYRKSKLLEYEIFDVYEVFDQKFLKENPVLEVEVLKSPQPSNPLAWSVANLQEWIFQIKSQIREWSLPEEVDAWTWGK